MNGAPRPRRDIAPRNFMVAVARIEGMKYACVRLEPDGDNAVNPIIKWICQLLRPASNVPIQAHLALSQFGPTVSAL